MLKWTRSRMSFANTISLIALFVALGGSAYAGISLQRNSVGAAQIKKNAVRKSEVRRNAIGTSEVRNGQLRAVDFDQDDLPAGPQGPQGLQGPEGTPGVAGRDGVADAYARVQSNGVLLPRVGTETPEPAFNVTQANVTNPAAGIYCFINLPFRPASAVVASDNTNATAANQNNFVASVVTNRGNNLGGCPNGPDTNARVVTTQINGGVGQTNLNHGFVIWFEQAAPEG